MRRVAATGDDGALSALYDRYAGMVYAMGLRLLGDRSLAEDLVQDVFASVWGKAESFDPSKASFTTWIYRIARNRGTDLDRRRRSRPASAGSDPLVYLAGGEDTRRLAERLDVAEALSRLSPDHQEVLALAYLEGHPAGDSPKTRRPAGDGEEQDRVRAQGHAQDDVARGGRRWMNTAVTRRCWPCARSESLGRRRSESLRATSKDAPGAETRRRPCASSTTICSGLRSPHPRT